MIIIDNKQAKSQFHILQTFEAGIVLVGDEPSSIRKGLGQIRGSFVKIIYSKNSKPEAWLVGAQIGKTENFRSIKLLLNRQEINSLIGSTQSKHLTVVPLKLFLKLGRFKLEIALAQGKQKFDRREEIKKRDLDREIRREKFSRYA